ncbi:hypothetical protein D9757_010039 [Collybiopsis confluens]|uniref:LYC1 C-terminal domain-containing protein n=1 Tax=Collybiopsis confluens TaxID=2823264 RepID=A0A8H5GQ88_9AGAR|nr:hypothetical protein D9757_010039 [Collybiopsis confluens]
MEPSNVSLFVATPEQAEVSRRRTGVTSWGTGRSLDEYIQRDLELEKSECGRDDKFITWILAPRDDSKTLEFLCACETFRRPGLVSKGGVVEEVECYGIASVFTPPEQRGKGYAHLMTSLLHWVLAGHVLPSNAFPSHIWGPRPAIPPGFSGKAVFSALWSDIGDFYENCNPDSPDRSSRNGWIITGTRTTKWHPKTTVPQWKSKTEGWIWLTEDQVRQICIQDAEQMRRELQSLKAIQNVRIQFTFLPSGGVEAFQRERQRQFWEKEGVTRWGVALWGDSNELETKLAFATWTLELVPSGPRTLVVTRLRALHPSHFVDILGKIWEYSIENTIEAVEIWNCPLNLTEVGYREARRWFRPFRDEDSEEFNRKGHLPSFKWYGLNGSDPQPADGEVEWVYNEKSVAASSSGNVIVNISADFAGVEVE